MPITIAYIHTSHVLIPLFSTLSKRELPGADYFHMVDESLIRNTIAAGELTNTTVRRLAAMIASARDAGADAVMVTCSSIGAAVPAVSRLFEFPVIRVDEAMAEQAVRIGKRVGVVATLRATLEPTVKLLQEKAAAVDRSIEVLEVLCEEAFKSLLAGDTETHDRLVTAAVTQLAQEVDVIVLAQASMARVVAAIPPAAVHVPILSSPELAVQRARSILSAERSLGQ
jgi:Asp/Glu/hydantoin racemase